MRLRSLVLSILIIGTPLVAQADTLNYGAAGSAAEATQNTTFGSATVTGFIGTMIAALLGLLGVIFLILTIYAGMLWMTAGGNADNVKKAKAILLNSVVGLVIVLSSYAIASTVIRYVGSNAN